MSGGDNEITNPWGHKGTFATLNNPPLRKNKYKYYEILMPLDNLNLKGSKLTYELKNA